MTEWDSSHVPASFNCYGPSALKDLWSKTGVACGIIKKKKKKETWSLSLHLESLEWYECLRGAKEISLFWEVLEASGWGLVTRKNKPWSEVWNFQPHSLTSGERGAGGWGQPVMVNDLINHAYIMKLSLKTLKWWNSQTLQIGEHIHMLGK